MVTFCNNYFVTVLLKYSEYNRLNAINEIDTVSLN